MACSVIGSWKCTRLDDGIVLIFRDDNDNTGTGTTSMTLLIVALMRLVLLVPPHVVLLTIPLCFVYAKVMQEQ